MKKVLALLVCVFILSGCSNTLVIGENDIDLIFKKFLSSETSLVNNYSKGYKYYLPTGVKVKDTSEYNEVLNYDGYNYYLYVDIVSYYYKTNPEYVVNNSFYFSKKLNYNGKQGYAEIEKINDKYRVEIFYNYAKIEAIVDSNNLRNTLVNISYILNSIKFNDAIVELAVGEDKDTLKEEKFDFYTPKKEGNFIDYINRYDDYEDEEVNDNENNIGNEE